MNVFVTVEKSSQSYRVEPSQVHFCTIEKFSKWANITAGVVAVIVVVVVVVFIVVVVVVVVVVGAMQSVSQSVSQPLAQQLFKQKKLFIGVNCSSITISQKVFLGYSPKYLLTFVTIVKVLKVVISNVTGLT